MNEARRKPSLALLHGGGQGSWVWEATLAALRAQPEQAFERILALDIPGCGRKRGRDVERLQPLEVAQELIADMEREGMSDIVLTGHSLAGNVLPRLIELRPGLFRRAVYVSCSIPLPGQTVLQMLGTGLHGSNDDEVGWPRTTSPRERYEAMYCNDMNEAQRNALLDSLEQDTWPPSFFSATDFSFENLAAVPSTYVVCLRDRILPVAWQEKFASRLNATEIVRIDAGHQAMITRPQELAQILADAAKS